MAEKENASHRLRCSRVIPPLTKDRIEKYKISCDFLSGRAKWTFQDEQCFLTFSYDEKTVCLPFKAEFSEKYLPWLKEAAVLMIESYIENQEFEKMFAGLEGEEWE